MSDKGLFLYFLRELIPTIKPEADSLSMVAADCLSNSSPVFLVRMWDEVSQAGGLLHSETAKRDSEEEVELLEELLLCPHLTNMPCQRGLT